MWGFLRRKGKYPWAGLPEVPEFPPGFEPPVVPSLRFNTTPKLGKYEVVLVAQPCCDNCVMYVHEGEDPSKSLQYRIGMQQFLDFGSPLYLTLTLVPGDRLNQEG